MNKWTKFFWHTDWEAVGEKIMLCVLINVIPLILLVFLMPFSEVFVVLWLISVCACPILIIAGVASFLIDRYQWNEFLKDVRRVGKEYFESLESQNDSQDTTSQSPSA